VRLEVEPGLTDAVERFMRDRHIPEIWATGCFRTIRFERAGPTTFRTCYYAAPSSDLERYLRDHAANFRADFGTQFPSGVSIARSVWNPVADWR
jgi:hypothetical protein